MSLFKNFIKLLETIPANKPILHQLDEIVLSLKRNFPLAKPKELRQEVLNAKRECNNIKKAYDKEKTGGFEPLDKIIKDNSSLNKPTNPPPSGGGLSGGYSSGSGKSPGYGGPMLGGGGFGPLWK